jgi:hypothetical protein
MRDKEGNTLLTRATYENSFRITDCILQIYKRRLEQQAGLVKQMRSGDAKKVLNADERGAVKREI